MCFISPPSELVMNARRSEVLNSKQFESAAGDQFNHVEEHPRRNGGQTVT